jgi:hypothetical protein
LNIRLLGVRIVLVAAAVALLGAKDTPPPTAAGSPVPSVPAPAVPPTPDSPPPQVHETVPIGAPAPADTPEIVVEAPEPRYVAPTRRDRIGRIWAPVMINGKGPFRLVLDTGASHSAVNAEVAHELGLPLTESNQTTLRGVTGSKVVPTVPVESMVFGDLEIQPRRLPIVTDALGGAEGVLGAEGLMDKRIVIDFRHDQISIKRSHMEKAERGMVTVPFHIVGGLLTVVDARIGDLRIKAIIDTGGQVSIGNMSLRSALLQMFRTGAGKSQEIWLPISLSKSRSRPVGPQRPPAFTGPPPTLPVSSPLRRPKPL